MDIFHKMNHNNNDTISEALDMEPNTNLSVIEEKETLTVIDPLKDFKMSHENTVELVKMGMVAAKELAGIAAQSQHPRAYEVFTNHLKTMVDIQKDFLGLKVPGSEEGNSPVNQTTNVNNAIMIGSTAELQRMLKAMAEENPIIDVTPKEVKNNEPTE